MKSFFLLLIFAFFFIPVKGWSISTDNKARIENKNSLNDSLAKTEDYFVINLTMGKQYSFALSERPVITFAGGDMIVTTFSKSNNIPIQSVTCGKLFFEVYPVVISANNMILC